MLLLHARSHAREGARPPGGQAGANPALPLLHPHGRCPHTPLPGQLPMGGRASSGAPSDYRRVGGINYGLRKPQLPARPAITPPPIRRLCPRSAGPGPPCSQAISEGLFQRMNAAPPPPPPPPPALRRLPTPTACHPACLGRERAALLREGGLPGDTVPPGRPLHPTHGCLQQGQGPHCRLWRGRKHGFESPPRCGN